MASLVESETRADAERPIVAGILWKRFQEGMKLDVDATVRYAVDKSWSVELTASNLFDKRYEHVVGYDAPRRAVLLSLRFESP